MWHEKYSSRELCTECDGETSLRLLSKKLKLNMSLKLYAVYF